MACAPKYVASYGSDNKYGVDGVGAGLGYYAGMLWPNMRLSSKEDAEAAALLCREAYSQGYAKAQQDIRTALGIE